MFFGSRCLCCCLQGAWDLQDGSMGKCGVGQGWGDMVGVRNYCKTKIFSASVQVWVTASKAGRDIKDLLPKKQPVKGQKQDEVLEGCLGR